MTQRTIQQAAAQYLPLFPFHGNRAGAVACEGELFIDNFAGAGGASTGIERATGRPVDHAINHNPVALGLHRVNHPHSHHWVEDVWEVDPRAVTGGRPVALAWFSPDCRHHSKAKGGKPVEKKIRGLAWVALRWAALAKPRMIALENVEEFKDWGRLGPDGRPDPKRKGETFRSFVKALEDQGYEVQWRELRACDYGAPTIRKRLFLIARRDGEAIVWPTPTHGAPGSPRVLSGELLPYRTAGECIDWHEPSRSVFDRPRPLVHNTLRRVAHGMLRYVLQAEQPFIVGGEAAGPLQAPAVLNKQHNNPPRAVTAPLSTITTNHNKNELMLAHLTTYYGAKTPNEVRGQSMNTPVATQTTENRHALVAATMIRNNGGGLAPQHASYSLAEPARTVLAQGGPQSLATGVLVGIDNASSRGSVWASGQPLTTIVTEARHALATAHLTAYYGAAHEVGQAVSEPARTVTTRDRLAVTVGTLMRQFGTSNAADATAPLGTVMPHGQGKTGAVTGHAEQPPLAPEQLDRARQCHDLLLEHLGAEALAPYSRAGLIVLTVAGSEYLLADIHLRMLNPRELARCQGFEDDYVLERDVHGNPVPKSKQVAGVGNSVCPHVAEAIVRVNLVEPQRFPQAAD